MTNPQRGHAKAACVQTKVKVIWPRGAGCRHHRTARTDGRRRAHSNNATHQQGAAILRVPDTGAQLTGVGT
jgi:hypothetical protein